MSAERILHLTENLYSLISPYELDGRPVSTHPRSARGFAPLNNYLFVADGEALLIDTGWPVGEATIIEQLHSVIGPDVPLSIFMLRQSDYNSVSNALPISESFNVSRIVLGSGIREPDMHQWLEFVPGRAGWREPTGDSALIKARPWSPAGASHIEGPGDIQLELVRSQLQLITTYWLYDDKSKTLITSDGFSYVWRPTAAGPWSVTDVSDAPTVDELCDYLSGSRFWWLAGARTERLRASLKEISDTYDVRQIAPAYGCALIGKEVVAAHFALMDAALERLAHRAPVGDDLAFHLEETV